MYGVQHKFCRQNHRTIQFQRHFDETLFQGLVWINAGEQATLETVKHLEEKLFALKSLPIPSD